MDTPVYANAAGVEEVVLGSATLSLPWRSRQIMLVNDSSAVNIEVFIGGGTGFSLKALETIASNLWIESVRVSAPSSASVRLIGFG